MATREPWAGMRVAFSMTAKREPSGDAGTALIISYLNRPRQRRAWRSRVGVAFIEPRRATMLDVRMRRAIVCGLISGLLIACGSDRQADPEPESTPATSQSVMHWSQTPSHSLHRRHLPRLQESFLTKLAQDRLSSQRLRHSSLPPWVLLPLVSSPTPLVSPYRPVSPEICPSPT